MDKLKKIQENYKDIFAKIKSTESAILKDESLVLEPLKYSQLEQDIQENEALIMEYESRIERAISLLSGFKKSLYDEATLLRMTSLSVKAFVIGCFTAGLLLPFV